MYSNCLKFILCHLLTNIYVFLFYINVFVFVLFYCRALLGGAAQFIGMRAYNLYKIRNDFFVSVSIYVRYIWLRTEVAARSTHRHTHTHRQARVHGHYTHTNSTKSNRSAQLLSGTRTHAHTHGEYATLSRCERVEPTRANESREAQQNAQKYSAQRRSRSRTPTPTATQLRERTCVVHSLLAWCDRTKTLSLSLSLFLSLFVLCFFLLALKTNIQSMSVLVFRADCSFQTVCAWAAIDCRNFAID